jgi:uncharacterized membrane protein
MSQTHVQEHIDVIAKHEQEFLAKRTRAERLGDSIAAFVGSLSFVAIHLSFFVVWMLVNTLPPGAIPHFDPFPFSLLGTVVALEGIVLASFIIMRQARMSKRAEERDHLMLQILLLTEKEITAVLGMDRQIAAQVGLSQVAKDKEITQLSKPTSIDDVAQAIQEGLPTE